MTRMSHFTCALCTFIGLALLVSASNNAIVDSMVKKYESWPCSRLISTTGVVGCGSRKEDANVDGAILFLVDNIEDLEQLKKFSGRVSIVTHDRLLQASFLEDLTGIHANNTNGVDILTVILAVNANQNGTDLPSPAPRSTFNPAGDGMLTASIPFSMTRLKTVEDSQDILGKARSNKARGYTDSTWFHGAHFDFYLGKESETSKTCLEKNMCDPLGGLSVWGTVQSNLVLEKDKEIVLLTTSMDSTAFYHDLAFGRNAGASNIVVSLLAAKALSEMEAAPTLARQIVVALFQGEAYGRLGSKRFVRDIASGEGCTKFETSYKNQSCANPMVYSLAWSNLKFEKISRIIAVGQLASIGDDFYVHTIPGDTNSADFRDTLVTTANGVSGIGAKQSNQNAIPPSPLDSFLEQGENFLGTGVFLSGFENTVPSSFHSRFDVNRGENEDLVGAKLAKVATVVARQLFVSAGGSLADAERLLNVQDSQAKELWGCFSTNFSCSLVASTLNQTTKEIIETMAATPQTATEGPKNGGPLSLFSSVYRPFMVENSRARLIELFCRNYLVVGAPNHDVKCKSDIDCLDTGGNCPFGNSSAICIKKGCMCSNVYFHDAVSVGIQYNTSSRRYALLDEAMPIWTEPRWSSPKLIVYHDMFTTSTNLILSLGALVLIGASWLGLAKAKSYLSETKFKLS